MNRSKEPNAKVIKVIGLVILVLVGMLFLPQSEVHGDLTFWLAFFLLPILVVVELIAIAVYLNNA